MSIVVDDFFTTERLAKVECVEDAWTGREIRRSKVWLRGTILLLVPKVK
jgi:hypothetical protein